MNPRNMVGALLLVMSCAGHDALAAGPYDGTWEGGAPSSEGCSELRVMLAVVDGKVTRGYFVGNVSSTTTMSGTVEPDGTAKIRYGSSNFAGNLKFQDNTFEGTMNTVSRCSQSPRIIKGERQARSVVIPPSSEIPKELAAFSGKWEGPFNGVTYGVYGWDASIVIEEIPSVTDVRVYFNQIGPVGNHYDWSLRAKGELVNRTLEFSFPDSHFVCSIENDVLICMQTYDKGGGNHGVLKRIKN